MPRGRCVLTWHCQKLCNLPGCTTARCPFFALYNNSPQPLSPSFPPLCLLCNLLHLWELGTKQSSDFEVCICWAQEPSAAVGLWAAPLRPGPVSCQGLGLPASPSMEISQQHLSLIAAALFYLWCKPFTQESGYSWYAVCSCCVRTANTLVRAPGAREVHCGALVWGCLHDAPPLHVNMSLDNPRCSSNLGPQLAGCCSQLLLFFSRFY